MMYNIVWTAGKNSYTIDSVHGLSEALAVAMKYTKVSHDIKFPSICHEERDRLRRENIKLVFRGMRHSGFWFRSPSGKRLAWTIVAR